MGTELILHSVLTQDNTLVHNMQSSNRARLEQIVYVMLEHGYEIMEDMRNEGGYHILTFWSLEDRVYTRVPRLEHSRILRLMRVNINKIDANYPHIISTYATVPPLRTRRPIRSKSPQRLFRD
jgi:hypothetical protein